jgi:chromosome segregation ATPase
MSNVSFKHTDTDAASEAQVKAFEDIERRGFGMGTLSVTIHEESDARDARDAAIDAAAATIKVVEQSLAAEKKLREQLASANAAFYREREEHTKSRLEAAREILEMKRAAVDEINLRKAEIHQLEMENASLKRQLGRRPKK